MANQFGETRETRAHKLECIKRARHLWHLARQMRLHWRKASLLIVMARIRLWVLRSNTRKARIKNLIGQPAIKSWYDRLAHGFALLTDTHTRPKQTAAIAKPIDTARTPLQPQHADGTGFVGVQNWFGLISAAPIRPRAKLGDKNIYQHATPPHTRPASQQRALPVIRFYPFELEPSTDGSHPEADFCWLCERPDQDGLILRPLKDKAAEAAKHEKRTRLLAAALPPGVTLGARLKPAPEP